MQSQVNLANGSKYTDCCRSQVPDMTFNGHQLKEAYQTLHTKVVETVDADSAVDDLFAAGILSPADNLELDCINDRIKKTRRLLARLHNDIRPKAFTVLHEAINKAKVYNHLIEEVEKFCRARAIRTGKSGN
jgi:hypothetical protein